MQVDPELSLKTGPRRLPGRLRRLATPIITGLGRPDVPITRNGKTHDLRWALLAVIQETPPAHRPR